MRPSKTHEKKFLVGLAFIAFMALFLGTVVGGLFLIFDHHYIAGAILATPGSVFAIYLIGDGLE